ncbi:MAG: hypothetical protein Q7J07_10400 [Pelolinea sp.]|nr:hypothetical protein [Pelolinea sp.]
MYGTIAKLKLKEGKLKDLKKHMDVEIRDIPGIEDVYVYQMDEDDSIMYLVVIFSSQDTYIKHAESERSNKQYLKMMKLLECEPEWHDGDLIFNRRFK